MKKYKLEDFTDAKELSPDVDVELQVVNNNFDIHPVRAYYMDGAFWPLDYDIMFPLFVTHWQLMPQANKPTDFEMFLSAPRIMKRYESE